MGPFAPRDFVTRCHYRRLRDGSLVLATMSEQVGPCPRAPVETCPFSTGEGTRRVQLVRRGGGGGVVIEKVGPAPGHHEGLAGNYRGGG